MARKSLLVLVTAAAAAGIIATGAAAGAALTGDDRDDGFGVAVSSSPSDDSTPSDDFTTPSGDASTPPGDPAPGAGAGAVSRDRAIDIALATTGGGTVVDTEAEWEHGRAAWKIEIMKGGVEHDVYVDRETGGIVKFDRDDDADDGRGRGGDGDDHSGKGRGGDDD